jgi:predicted SprT family Zn-dependent metalloprotease
MKPTDELYKSLDFAYQHFNKHLFANTLPLVLFTLQRQKGTMGYFIPDRWTSTSGKYCHEISINPAHMGSSRVIDVMQTLVHEMVHCWQFCHGNPSRSGYHNKEWAYKMIDVGLQPSITGEPGGGIVGNHMNDYVIDDGLFKKSCVNLIQNEDFHIPWIYRLIYSQAGTEYSLDIDSTADSLDSVMIESDSLQQQDSELNFITESILSNPEQYLYSSYKDLLPDKAFFSSPFNKNAKSKYQCPSCRLNVWAKPNIRLLCIECERELRDVSAWS